MINTPKTELTLVLEWAKEKIHNGSEPPWAWYQYMKLQEAIEAIISSSDVAITMENSPQSVQHSEKRLQLVDSTYLQGISQHHPSDGTVQMPM